MFCELCVYPCPKDCIHMGTEFALVTTDRSELNFDLLSFKGMAREAKIRMREADAKKAAKEAAKAAKAAGGASASAPEELGEEPEETSADSEDGEA
jgi:formate hydrogenlyase subunit 6/NADH:ubiquinone oxidoreductase subunit I